MFSIDFLKSLNHFGILATVLTLANCEFNCYDGTNLQYETGKAYVYFTRLVSYDDQEKQDWLFNIDSPSTKGNIITEGNVVLTALENCEYVLTLQNLTHNILGRNHEPQAGLTIPRTSVKFSFRNGQVSNLTKNSDERSPWVMNIARGILTTIQNQGLGNDSQTPRLEKNIRGNCLANIVRLGEGVYHKQMLLWSCSDQFVSDSNGVSYSNSFYKDNYKTAAGIPDYGALLNCTQTIRDHLLSEVNCNETNLLSGLAHRIEVKSRLVLEKFGQNPYDVGGPVEAEIGTLTVPTTILYDSTPNTPEDYNWNKGILQEIVKAIFNMYDDQDANKAELYLQLAEKLAFVTNFTELEVFLTKMADQEGIDFNFIKNVTVDAALRVNTDASINYIIQEISADTLTDGPKTIFFRHLPFTNNATGSTLVPLSLLLSDQWTTVQNESYSWNENPSKSYRQIVLAASGYGYQFCRQQQNCKDEPRYTTLVNEIANGASSNDPQIFSAVLHALGNLPHLTVPAVEAINLILQTEKNEPKRLTALEAFRRNPCRAELKQTARDLLKSNFSSSELRMSAYLSITRCFVKEDAKAVESILQSEPNSDLSSFIATHISYMRESKSPSKQYIQHSLLTGIKIFRNNTSVHVSKYSEISAFRPEENLGFSLNGHILFRNFDNPRFFTLNVTLDIFGKSFNNFEIGISRRCTPNINILMMQNPSEQTHWAKTMLPALTAPDSFYRFHGTTVSMGSDILDTIDPTEFVNIGEDLESMESDFSHEELINFAQPLLLFSHSVTLPTASGLPLSISAHALRLSTFTAHKLDDTRVNVTTESSFLAGFDVSLGKGTPIEFGANAAIKLHSNSTLGSQFPMTSSDKKLEMKIEFPDMQIWSERITLSRQFYTEVHGSKVKASDVTNKLWMPQNPRNIFTFTTMGLNISGQTLPNPTELETDSIDVILLVEKAEEQFSGYTFNRIIQFNNDSDSNEVTVVLSTDGLATEESFEITWTCSHKTANDLENDEDRPKDDLNLGATYSRGNQAISGFNFQYSSRGFKKSELNMGDEDSTRSFLSDITARRVKRLDYLIRLEITDNGNEAIPLLTWNLTNNKNDARIHLSFEGPLNRTLGIIQGSISKTESVNDDKFMIMVYEEPNVQMKADLMIESVAFGTNKLKTEVNFETGNILWNTSVEHEEVTFELVQTLKSSLIDEEFHGSGHVVKNTTKLYTYAAHYQDSYSNNGSFTTVYSRNYLDLGNKQYSTLKSIIIQADTNALKNPLSVELSVFKEFDSTGEIIYDGRKHLTLSLYWNIFGFQLGQFIYDRNKTEKAILTKDRILCGGRLFRVYSDSNTAKWRCTTSTNQLQIYAENYFEFLLTTSNTNEISLDLYAYLPQTKHLVNITGMWEVPTDRYKRTFKTTAFLDNIPNYGTSWTSKSEMDVNEWNRTLQISNELTRNVSSSITEWKTKIDTAWARDILNGESSMKIVYDDPRHVTITVDILNNATTGSSTTNKLTAVVDTAGLAKIFIPKKQLTWLVSVENDDVYRRSNIAFKIISDLKWESLSFLADEEIFHLREDFDVKIKYAFDWVLKGGGSLTSMEKEIAAYNYSTHLNILQSSNKSRISNTFGSKTPVRLTLDATGWLSDETDMGKTVNNTFSVSSQSGIHPQQKFFNHLLKFNYRQIKEQNVTKSLDAELRNHYMLKDWSNFVNEDQILWTVRNRTCKLWRKAAVAPGPMVTFHLVRDSENSFNYGFAAAVFKGGHQNKFHLQWNFAHNTSRVSPHYSSFENSAFDLSNFYLVISG